jgi:hypothetical protein
LSYLESAAIVFGAIGAWHLLCQGVRFLRMSRTSANEILSAALGLAVLFALCQGIALVTWYAFVAPPAAIAACS